MSFVLLVNNDYTTWCVYWNRYINQFDWSIKISINVTHIVFYLTRLLFVFHRRKMIYLNIVFLIFFLWSYIGPRLVQYCVYWPVEYNVYCPVLYDANVRITSRFVLLSKKSYSVFRIIYISTWLDKKIKHSTNRWNTNRENKKEKLHTTIKTWNDIKFSERVCPATYHRCIFYDVLLCMR